VYQGLNVKATGQHFAVDIFAALNAHGGIAKTQELHKLGVHDWQIRTTVAKGSVIRLRKGWYAIHTIRPIERRAFIDRGLLTCASAAEVLGLPFKTSHYHLRATRPIDGVLTNCRRTVANRRGGCVAILDWVEDYLHCQDPEWSLALLDAVSRSGLLTKNEWEKLEQKVPKRLKKLVALRNPLAESPLESIARFNLLKDRIPFSSQVTFGRYRADFVIGANLILETHGAQFHSSKSDWERDRERVLWFKSQGWDVLEVSFQQVLEWEQVRIAIKQRLRRR
jgi:very-short-patch-repair endonuclease